MPVNEATLARRGLLFISDDRTLIDIELTHQVLAASYWSPGIARQRVERGIANSLCYGVYDQSRPRSSKTTLGTQVGFARVITDAASFAYLCDVFIVESARGGGVGTWLIDTIVNHAPLCGLRRFCLMTRDAHGLYAKFGFTPMPDPTRYMERVDRESYKQA